MNTDILGEFADNQEKVTAEIIRQGCHNYLKNTSGY